MYNASGFNDEGLKQPVIFMCCTFMDRDVYSADAPGSIPTLLTINILALYGCSMEQPYNPVYRRGCAKIFLTQPLLFFSNGLNPSIL